MRAFTISNASTLMGCRYSFRSDVVMPPEGPPDADCEHGQLIHSRAAMLINSSDTQEVPETGHSPDSRLEKTWACARAWILSNWSATWVAEPAYAWGVKADTARLLGVDIDRKYDEAGKLPHEIAGTLDVCGVEGNTVFVYEFGTGHDVSHKYEQLRLQCAVAALAHGCSRAVGRLVRFSEDGVYPSVPVEFSSFELEAIRGEFAWYLAEVKGSVPTPGEHCSRCNLAPVCPAATGIVQALLPAEALVRPGWGLAIASPDHAAWLLARARLVAIAAEAVKDAVKAYVPKDGLELADGSLLVEGTRRMPRRDNAKLEALARACGATDAQIAGCDYVAVESAGLKIKKPATAKKRKAA